MNQNPYQFHKRRASHSSLLIRHYFRSETSKQLEQQLGKWNFEE
jgi:hypothetical protein